MPLSNTPSMIPRNLLLSEDFNEQQASGEGNKVLSSEEVFKNAPVDNESSEERVYNSYGLSNIGSLTSDSLSITPYGMLWRRSKIGTADIWDKYSPNEQEYSEIMKAVGYSEDGYRVAVSGASNMTEVRANIGLYKENLQINDKLANSSWGSQLYSGIIGVIGNPIDHLSMAVYSIPVVGPALGTLTRGFRAGAIGSRIAYNVGTGVAANQVASQMNGLNTDVWRDIGGIVTVSTAFEALGYGVGKLKTTRVKTILNHDKLLNNQPLTPEDLPNTTKVMRSKGFITKANDAREFLESGLPSVEVKSKLLDLRKQSDSLMNIIDNLTHFEQGVRKSGFKQYLNTQRKALPDGEIPVDQGTTLLGSGKSTFFEEVNKLRNDSIKYLESAPNIVNRLSKRYGRDKVNEYLIRKLEGDTIPKDLAVIERDVETADLVKNIGDFFKERGMQLYHSDLIDNIYSAKNYVPLRIDTDKKIAFVKSSGGSKAAQLRLQKYLFDGVLNDSKSYKLNYDDWADIRKKEQEAKVEKLQGELEQARLDGATNKVAKLEKSLSDIRRAPKETQADLEAEFNDYLWDKAGKDAYAYLDQGVSRDKTVDNYSDFAMGFSFTKHRTAWNTSYRDSSGFSLNSIRADLIDTTLRYNSRASGLIASKRVYGKDFSGFLEDLNETANDYMNRNNKDPKFKDEAMKYIGAMYRRGFGMSVAPDANIDYSIGDAISQMLRNGTFATVGTLMGPLNLGEIGALVNAYGASTFFKSIPGLGKMVNHIKKTGHFSPEDIDAFRKHIVGKEFLERSELGESIRKAQSRYEGNIPEYLAKAVGYTDYVSQHSPASYLMQAFTDSINRVITDSISTELVFRAMESKFNKKGVVNPKVLNRLNISDSDMKYLYRVLRKCTYIENGSPRLRDNFGDIVDKDDKFRDIFTRLHTYLWEEALQRRNPDDIFTYQLNKGNSIFELAMQFKSFAVMSYNKRFVKAMNRYEDGESLGILNTVLTTTALSSIVNIGISYTRSLGMDKQERRDYLDRTIGFHDLRSLTKPENLPDILFYNLFNRNPYLAAPALLANTLGFGTSAKTTATTGRGSSTEGSQWMVGSVDARTLADMIPSSRLAFSSANFALGMYNYGVSQLDNSTTYQQRKQIANQLRYGMNMLPYIPYLTPVSKDFVQDYLDNYKVGF